jgi:D-3-phosphoglycerate dehydrogenase
LEKEVIMSAESTSTDGKMIWLMDDEFDSNQIDQIRKLLENRGFELVVSRGKAYRDEYPKYAPHAKGILLQVGFQLGEEDIKGLTACEIIAVTGIGVNDLDVAAVTKQGIIATNVPDFCIEDVSDHVLAIILGLNRRLPECQAMTRSGMWQAIDILPIKRLKGQVLGLVGFGKIGRAVARKAKCFGMRVVTHDPYCDESEMNKLNVEGVGFDELIRSSDFISLHVPLTKETYHLIDADKFDSMKRTAYLVNTCRGDVVDESALIDALKTNKIAGAGLDVLSKEPPDPDNPLLELPNVLVTPHSAFISEEALTDLALISTQAVFDKLQEKIPKNIINPEVLKA